MVKLPGYDLRQGGGVPRDRAKRERKMLAYNDMSSGSGMSDAMEREMMDVPGISEQPEYPDPRTFKDDKAPDRARGAFRDPGGPGAEYAKGNPDMMDYTDYNGTRTPEGRERLGNVLKYLGDQIEPTDSGLNSLQGFVESPEGAAMYDVWQKTGDPAPFLQRLQMFNTQSYTVPPDLLNGK